MRGSFYPNLGLRYTGEVEIGVGKEKMSTLGLSFSGKDRTKRTKGWFYGGEKDGDTTGGRSQWNNWREH